MLNLLWTKCRKSGSATAKSRELEAPLENKKGEKKGGVLINGVIWATCNIGKKGKFVSQPHDSGNLYTWEKAKRACPAGWRLPTVDELKKLLQAPNRWTNINGVYGREFGTYPNTIFLPAAGFLDNRDGMLEDAGAHGDYWSSTHDMENSTQFCCAYFLKFNRDNDVDTGSWGIHRSGFSVRCVAE